MPYPLPPTLSPSRVAAYTDCALAYRFANLDRLPEPPSPSAAKGTLVHAALERLFQLDAGERTPAAASACLDDAAAALAADPELDGLDIDDDFMATAHRMLDGYFRMEDPRTVTAIGLELKLRAEIGGVHVTGIIDRLDRLPDGGLVVIDYKGLSLDTPLPTPSGWTTMADVAVGDEVLGADGLPTRVIAKSDVHHRRCYQLSFSDGTSVVCDNEHLWNVVQVGARWRGDRTPKTVDADTLYELHLQCRAEGRPRGLVIENCESLDLPERSLPIDPWLLGVWLGDGRAKDGSVTVGKEDQPWMLEQFALLPYSIHVDRGDARAAQVRLNRADRSLCRYGHPYDGGTRRSRGRVIRMCPTCRQIEQASRGSEGGPDYGQVVNASLTNTLRELGLLQNKHVPMAYLRASAQQRLALLQGLMDTDGHWHAERRRVVFVTTTPPLAAAVRELVHSLGVTTYAFVKDGVHRVEFRPVGFNPFRLPRKAAAAERAFEAETRRSYLGHATRRAIVGVEPIDSVPTQCIAVDAADSLYLCGRSMVPTHNTGRAPSERYEQGKLLGVDTYALLCERVLGVRPVAVRLLYVAEGVSITCTPSDRAARFIEQKVGAVWLSIQRANARDAFGPRPGKLCDWCSFRAWCPAFGGDPEEARRLGEERRGRTELPFAAV